MEATPRNSISVLYRPRPRTKSNRVPGTCRSQPSGSEWTGVGTFTQLAGTGRCHSRRRPGPRPRPITSRTSTTSDRRRVSSVHTHNGNELSTGTVVRDGTLDHIKKSGRVPQGSRGGRSLTPHCWDVFDEDPTGTGT